MLLDDPERLFGSQNVVMVVGEDKLDSIDADAFLTVVDTVNRTLTETGHGGPERPGHRRS